MFIYAVLKLFFKVNHFLEGNYQICYLYISQCLILRRKKLEVLNFKLKCMCLNKQKKKRLIISIILFKDQK